MIWQREDMLMHLHTLARSPQPYLTTRTNMAESQSSASASVAATQTVTILIGPRGSKLTPFAPPSSWEKKKQETSVGLEELLHLFMHTLYPPLYIHELLITSPLNFHLLRSLTRLIQSMVRFAFTVTLSHSLDQTLTTHTHTLTHIYTHSDYYPNTILLQHVVQHLLTNFNMIRSGGK